MSLITISDLKYITPQNLASKLLSSSPPPSDLAIVDVRDSDHIGGNIITSLWVPSSTLDYRIPELIRQLRAKRTVVFHCSLSQQRGPSAALRYMRERERLSNKDTPAKGSKGEEPEREDGDGKGHEKQDVLVLEGGFTQWQSRYGEDERLTKDYVKDIWAD